MSDFCDPVYKFSSRPLLKRPKSLHPLLRSRGYSWRNCFLFNLFQFPSPCPSALSTLILEGTDVLLPFFGSPSRYCSSELYVLRCLLFKFPFLLRSRKYRSTVLYVLRLFQVSFPSVRSVFFYGTDRLFKFPFHRLKNICLQYNYRYLFFHRATYLFQVSFQTGSDARPTVNEILLSIEFTFD